MSKRSHSCGVLASKMSFEEFKELECLLKKNSNPNVNVDKLLLSLEEQKAELVKRDIFWLL